MIIPLHALPESAWNGFVFNHPYGWFWHTTYFLDYLKVNADNRSFAYVVNGEVMAIFPLVLRDGRPVDGSPMAAPLFRKSISEQEIKECYAHLAYLMEEMRCDRLSVRTDAVHSKMLCHQSVPKFFSGCTTMKTSYIASLKCTTSRDHFSIIRKSYRNLIRQADSKLRLIADYDDWLKAYELIRYDVKGMACDDETYQVIEQWVASGYARCFFAFESGSDPVGACLMIAYKNKVYYASMATRMNNVAHWLLWHAMDYFRLREFDVCEIGFGGWTGSEKEHSIEFFKSGMGGFSCPFLVFST